MSNIFEKWNNQVNWNIVSTKNETCEKKFNDDLMEKMFEDYPNLETKINKVAKNEKEKWKWTFKSCMFKKLNGNLMGKCILMGFFNVNNNKKVHHNNPILCYSNPINAFNPII